MPSPTPTKPLAIALLALFTTASHAESPLPLDPIPVEQIQARYSDDQLQRISKVICIGFDLYKKNNKSFLKAKNPSCKTPNEFVCRDEGDYLSMRGIVRSSTQLALKIEDPTEFENTLPGVVSELMTRSCPRPSIHNALDIPFLKQNRNIAKRAIFLGNTQYFFDEFVFDEYSWLTNGKRQTLIDINAVEYIEPAYDKSGNLAEPGGPETLLDYLDKILKPNHIERLGNSSRGDVSALRRDLILYGAKRVSEMDCRNQPLFPCQTPEQGVASP